MRNERGQFIKGQKNGYESFLALGHGWNKGIPLTQEHRKKIGQGNKGKKLTSEQLAKVFIRMRTNHPRYISDRTKLKPLQVRNDYPYQDWRKQVWLRDNFKCKIANPDCKGRIEAHHILGWSEHPELRYQVNNGITLCHAHHPRKRAEEKRLVSIFQELVSVSKVKS